MEVAVHGFAADRMSRPPNLRRQASGRPADDGDRIGIGTDLLERVERAPQPAQRTLLEFTLAGRRILSVQPGQQAPGVGPWSAVGYSGYRFE
jgi:hypothetical protein